MEIICQKCDVSFAFDKEPPRFCQNCGSRLAEQTQNDMSTIAPSSQHLPTDVAADRTIAPTQPVAKTVPTGEGEIVGPYQLVRWLGSGGMGTVWEAVETKTGRRVALKRLSKSMATDTKYVQRFIREAQLCAKISHPKVTFIYGSGSDDGQPYIAMELMPGKTLEDVVNETGGPLETSYAVDCIIDACEGLAAAHRMGMIHRDVKPSNCFLDTDDSVKIGDFGLSKSLFGTDVNLTQTGTFMGTPSYAAPEQIRGSDLDERTDVYSVGATLFNLLTGRTPFLGDAMTVTAQIVTDEAPLVSKFNSSIPKGLVGIVAKCMEKDPAKRFQTLDDLKLALIPFATNKETVFGDIGRRLAAFMIDQTIIFTVHFSAIFLLMIAVVIQKQVVDKLSPDDFQIWLDGHKNTISIASGIFLFIFTLLYYAILEGKFGKGVGKFLMGLRTVNGEGQTPGFFRMLLRAFVVPACFGCSLLYAIVVINNFGSPETAADTILSFLGSVGFGTLFSLALLSTMRQSNGLLGVHGILSGTRVIRPYQSSQKIPVVEPKPGKLEPMQFGPYYSDQLMGESQFGKVLLGRDEPLNRSVWVVHRKQGSEPPLNRINLARVSRQRWLEGGNLDNGERWDAFEAINGVPIQTYIGIKSDADWSHYQRVMTGIVEEVREAINDNTLPETLDLPLVWLDEDGHAKLLDKQLVNVVDPNQTVVADDCQMKSGAGLGSSSSTDKPVERGVKLVQQLGDLFQRTSILPSSVQSFLGELMTRPRTMQTLDWAHEKLQSLSKNVTGLSWDSRIGIFGATLGVEVVVYLTIAAMIHLFCDELAPIPNVARFFSGAFLGIILPMTLAIYFNGGPVFRFMGVQVTNNCGRPARPWKCALRAGISWFPAVVLTGCFIIALILNEAHQNQMKGMELEPGSIAYAVNENPAFAVGYVIAFLLSALSILVGMVAAILSPKRGLVDFLLRTRLLPK